MPGDILPVSIRQNTDVCIAEMRADIRYIKDVLDKAVVDHETRLRALEQSEEPCKQSDVITTLTKQVEVHGVRIKSLEDCHTEESGARKASMSIRELLSWVLTVVLGFLALIQFVRGT